MGFFVGFASGDLAVIEDPAYALLRNCATAAIWMAWLSLRLPRKFNRCRVRPPEDTSTGAVPL